MMILGLRDGTIVFAEGPGGAWRRVESFG